MGPDLVALSATISGPAPLRLQELVHLVANEGIPVTHALHMVDGPPSTFEAALLLFPDRGSASRALELLDGYPMGPSTFLEADLRTKAP
jgi:hypothetical protein